MLLLHAHMSKPVQVHVSVALDLLRPVRDVQDEVGLPMMRKHFTYKEFNPVERKIVSEMGPEVRRQAHPCLGRACLSHTLRLRQW